jgi:hypothetical protein
MSVIPQTNDLRISVHDMQFQSMIFMFTMENTEGFDQKTLDKMNAEVKKTMSKHDPKSKNYKKLVEQVEDQVFDKYCSEVFRPSLKL